MEITSIPFSPIYHQFIEQQPFPIKYFHFRTSQDPVVEQPKGFYAKTNYAARLYHTLLKNSGFTEIENYSKANIILGTNLNEQIKNQLSPLQRVTHYDKTFCLGSKAGYHKIMKEYEKFNGEHPPFYSETYLLPEEKDELAEAFETSPLWIRKPAGGSRGNGISVINELPSNPGRIVVQKYISNPLLINGLKFDLRFYVAVASLNPLQLFVHKNGLVRLATEPYNDNFDNLENNFAHLTNFSINKNDEHFQATDDMSKDGTGNKWTHAPLWPFLEKAGFDPNKIRHDIDDAFTAVIGTARNTFIDQNDHMHAFELFGFDVMLDETGHIYILEVNVTPAMGTSSGLDLFVKEPVLKDLFNIGLIPLQSLEAEENYSLIYTEQKMPKNIDLMKKDPAAAFAVISEFENRLQKEGDFRCIYPTPERINTLAPKFPYYSAYDRVLENWIKMNNEEKLSFLQISYPAYIQALTSSSLDNAE